MESGRAHRVDAHLGLEDAGVVDEATQPFQRLVRGLEQSDDIEFERDVGGHSQGPSTRRFNIRDDPVGGFLVLPVVDTIA